MFSVPRPVFVLQLVIMKYLFNYRKEWIDAWVALFIDGSEANIIEKIFIFWPISPCAVSGPRTTMNEQMSENKQRSTLNYKAVDCPFSSHCCYWHSSQCVPSLLDCPFSQLPPLFSPAGIGAGKTIYCWKYKLDPTFFSFKDIRFLPNRPNSFQTCLKRAIAIFRFFFGRFLLS